MDDATDARVVDLLNTNLSVMRDSSPPESVFALDMEGLRAPDVTFWTMWDGDVVIASGALRELPLIHGEVKSMHTLQAFRGRGAGAQMLEHILNEARSRNYLKVSLETGSPAVFSAAQRLYRRYGFEYCEAFAPYEPNPFSVFMSQRLSQ